MSYKSEKKDVDKLQEHVDTLPTVQNLKDVEDFVRKRIT